jgi:Tol biopolymer transport system component
LHPNNEDPRALPEIWTTGGIKKFETNLTKGEQPQVSPDGSKIVFVDPDHNLSIINCDGNRLTQLTTKAKTILDSLEKKLTPSERDDFQKHPELYLPYSNPCWSPDGKFILYSSLEGTDSTGRPNEDIWIMPSDGGTATQVTSNGSADIYPVISPDKKTIYFISNRVNGWAIYRIESPPELLGGQ